MFRIEFHVELGQNRNEIVHFGLTFSHTYGICIHTSREWMYTHTLYNV